MVAAIENALAARGGAEIIVRGIGRGRVVEVIDLQLLVAAVDGIERLAEIGAADIGPDDENLAVIDQQVGGIGIGARAAITKVPYPAADDAGW